VPLAYYAVEARRDFWDEHWGGTTLADALRTAAASPLTAALDAALPRDGRVLEAGCGLGQYVVWFRRRGRAVFGVDWSVAGLREGRTASPPPPLAAMDLAALGFRDATFGAYVSLGVVEHDPAGPDILLAEARRVLAPGGTLLISVPYVNGVRRLGRWWIRRANTAVAARGGAFYQFAFGRREFAASLGRHGFRVRSAWPYDPARILRRWRRRAGGGSVTSAVAEAAGGGGVRGILRRALYTAPGLALLGHMILFVATRED
jgi:SAM-dependent methyltransferase